jgi:hypothetical protein
LVLEVELQGLGSLERPPRVLLRRPSDVVDCKVEVMGEPPGGLLGGVIVDYLERNCSRPQVIVPAGLTATISRLEASGYKLYNRLARLAIDLKEFNLDNFRGYIERLSTEGFQFHCMDSIPLSPRVGAQCIWCGVWYLNFSLSFLIGFPMLWMGVSIVYC